MGRDSNLFLAELDVEKGRISSSSGTQAKDARKPSMKEESELKRDTRLGNVPKTHTPPPSGVPHILVEKGSLLTAKWTWRRFLGDAVGAIVLVIIVAAFATSVKNAREERSSDEDNSLITCDVEVASVEAFKTTQELYDAVDAYLGNALPNISPSAFDTQEYGHPIGMWDVSQLTDLSHVFDLHFREKDIRLISAIKNFNEDISGWNVSQVETMEGMFYGVISFNQPLQSWDTKSVTSTKKMFMNAYEFNQPLGAWDVRRVKIMDSMFSHASAFNQPLDEWKVIGVTSMAYMFRSAKAFDQPLQAWNVSAATDMQGMFLNARFFNHPLDSWDVSSVQKMQWMFGLASRYNQPMDKWIVTSVTNTSNMFRNAASFNRELCSWGNRFDPRVTTDLDDMFTGTTCPRQGDPDLKVLPPSPFCHGCD